MAGGVYTGVASSRGTVSVVIPCLNERLTIAEVVSAAHRAFARWPAAVEVIVADNGSTDGSIDLARAAGARVIEVAERGYGAALRAGFTVARGDYIVYADGDLTYDLGEARRLVEALHDHEADMILGTRMRGGIESGAMPMLHRLVGTPVLTFLINRLFGGSLSDCNSGFRAFRREQLLAWRPVSPGMEFASELLINALRAGASIIEVPVMLRRDHAERQPHLSTWRDGMRHLLTILARAPALFVNTGLAILLISALIAVACTFGPRLILGRFALLDYHTLILASLMGFVGTQLFGAGLLLQIRFPRPVGRLARSMLALDEGVLFWLLLGIVATVGSGVGFVMWNWGRHGFANIGYLRLTLSILYVATVVGAFWMSVFYAHLLKRA
jgi:glycosyltransferase involved in cell wall biosynthesis